MKTAKQLIEETEPILAALHWQLAPRHEIEAALSKMFTAIQRDAREGWVPESDYDDLLRVASHMHVNNQKDDSCAKCGLDLRHIVHRQLPGG